MPVCSTELLGAEYGDNDGMATDRDSTDRRDRCTGFKRRRRVGSKVQGGVSIGVQAGLPVVLPDA